MDRHELRRFFNACNPAKTLDMEKSDDRQYYIDCSSVRGGETIKELSRTIQLSNEPTCQLFTGHIGCGKSTELLRLKTDLEKHGYYVVYCDSSSDLDLGDVDISDILLSIVHQVVEDLKSKKIKLKSNFFANLFTQIATFFKGIEISGETELSIGIAKITAQTRESPNLRHQLREFLDLQTGSIIRSINEEILIKASAQIQKIGKQGMVVIVDNLEKVTPRRISSEIPQLEYLFIERGAQLRGLNCHVVYTVPLELTFANEVTMMISNLGGGMSAKVLPMIPVKLGDGSDCSEGIALLQQIVMSRAFPKSNMIERTNYKQIWQVFEDEEILNQLLQVSGGHARQLLALLYRCLQIKDPPISKNLLETVVRERREELKRGILDAQWELLHQVVTTKKISNTPECQSLLRNGYVFEYRIDRGIFWFDINPILLESPELQLGIIYNNFQ